jgi:hypothetical protein
MSADPFRELRLPATATRNWRLSTATVVWAKPQCCSPLETWLRLKNSTSMCRTVVRELHEKRKQFVVLETLDMEPLPSTANLLAAILVRISARFEYSSRDSYPRVAVAFDEPDAREKLAFQLHQLELDAVLAWTGTERKRSRIADPSSYAAEVLASERAGLSLQPRLDEVLDGLARKVFGDGRGIDPIFLLPVDDFDLAPSRCLELLRIVRIVSTPRLFFLIAGNTRIAESILRLQGEGELSLIAPGFASGREAGWVRATASLLGPTPIILSMRINGSLLQGMRLIARRQSGAETELSHVTAHPYVHIADRAFGRRTSCLAAGFSHILRTVADRPGSRNQRRYSSTVA